MAMTTEHRSHPTLSDCRTAVRRIRAMSDGTRALASLRPRGVSGVYRDRLPAALLLYLAGLEHRLVWQDVDGLAMLEPPLARPDIWRRRRIDMVGVLRWVDAQWGLLMFAAPIVGMFAVATVLALWLDQPFAAVIVVLIAMIYLAVLMTAQVVFQAITVRRETPRKNALGSVTGDQWTMPLFHQENEKRIEELLDRVQHRLEALIRDEAEQAARDRGAEISQTRMSAELACPHAGVTTNPARDRVAARHPIVHERVSIGRFDRRPDDPPRRPYRPVPFVLTYVLGVVLVVSVLAVSVADIERDGCAPASCAAGPMTYADTFTWGMYRLLGQNAPGVVPATGYTLVLGWLITLMGATGVMVLIVAASRSIKRAKEERKIIEEQIRRGRTRLLLVTVADEECEAVLDTIERHVGRAVKPRFDRLVPVYEMGEVNDTEIFVVQATQGLANAGGAILTAGEAIRQIDPHYALIAGMCYGLKPDQQQMGGILVSAKIKDLDAGKIIDPAGALPGCRPLEILRGEIVTPSAMLLTAIKAARREWQRARRDVTVSDGLMLAWGKLVNSETTVRQLCSDHPDAIGADMEGAGFYAAARAGRVESILVKAICDWGYGRDDDRDAMEEAKRTASRNAADFILHLVLSGVFSRSPDERVSR